jgi:hypothetical protein
LLGPIGLVVAAFTAAYQAGKKLDSLIGISDAVAKRFGGDTSATDELAKQTAILRARREGRTEAAKIDDESAALADRRLKGVAKLEADYARESAAIQKKLSITKNSDVKAALQSRLDMMKTFHTQDVAAAKQAEEEKAKAMQAATESRTRSLRDENERMQIAMLDGVAKVQAQFEKTIKDINEQIAEAETPEQKTILEQRKVIVEEQRDRDLAALRPEQKTESITALLAEFTRTISDLNEQIAKTDAPEQKMVLEKEKTIVKEQTIKQLAALRPEQKTESMTALLAEFTRKISDLNEQIAKTDAPEQKTILEKEKTIVKEQTIKQLAALQPEQKKEERRVSLARSADNMATVGGFLGRERTGLSSMSKQERLYQENNKALKINGEAIQTLTAQVEQLASAITGGVA